MGACFGKSHNNALKTADGPSPTEILQSKVIAVKDGDTVVVLSTVKRADITGRKFMTIDEHTIRVAGINSPEMPKKAELAPNMSARERKRVKLSDLAAAHPEHPGLRAKEACKAFIPIGSIVILKVKKTRGKYGRMIADIIHNGNSLAEHMLKTENAVAFMN